MKKKKEKKIGMFRALWKVSSKADRVGFVLLFILGIFASFAVLVPTQIISMIISKLSGEEMLFFGIKFSSNLSYVWLIVIGGVITFIMRNIKAQYDLSIERILRKAISNLRVASYDWLVSPRKNMDLKMTQGDAIYRMNQTPETLTTILIDLFETIIPSVLSAVIAFIYIVTLDLWSMLILSVGIILVILCVVIRTIMEKKITFRKEKASSTLSSMASNTISNISIINLYKSMAYESKLFREKVNVHYAEQKKQINLRLAYWTAVRFIEVMCMFLTIFVCAQRIYEGTMIVGNIIVITNYVTRIFEPVQSIGYYTTHIIQSMVIFDRFEELKPKDEDLLPVESTFENKIESITLENVSAKNGENFKIDGINLKFNKGEFVAVSGESGCGKTTLIRLLCGLCERTSGKILVNDKEKINHTYTLVDKMSVSMQDAYIFNRDAKLNILYPDGTEIKDYKPLIKKLSMDKIFNRKYDENNDQNFENQLSGGEKKRIGISRALLREAEVYIFDEPTNDLDSKNARVIIDEIDKLKENAIVIVVSHDDRVLKKADRIIKFEKTLDNLVEVVEV